MDRQYLFNCLNKFFLDSWSARTHERMTSLMALVAYYNTGDLPDALREDVNRLSAALLQIDLLMECAKSSETDMRSALEECNEKLAQLATVDVVGLGEFVRQKALNAGHMAFVAKE